MAAPEGEAPWLGDEGPAPDICVRLRAQGAGIRAAVWGAEGPARGHALLFPGRTEYLEKYVRVVGWLRGRGLAVAAADWRGQGLSDRESERLGHVGDFAEFQSDVAALLGWDAVAGLPGPRLLMAHSMGGCIGLRALVDGPLSDRAQRPEAAVFSAPMWGLATPFPQSLLARVSAFLNARLGRGEAPLPGRPEEATYVASAPFENNLLTTDREHWDWFVRQARENPELTLAAPTWGWLDAALREMQALSRAQVPPVPRLLLLGEAEAVVSPSAIRAHDRRFAEAELAAVPQGRHETLMETPARDPGRAARAAVERFLDARGM